MSTKLKFENHSWGAVRKIRHQNLQKKPAMDFIVISLKLSHKLLKIFCKHPNICVISPYFFDFPPSKKSLIRFADVSRVKGKSIQKKNANDQEKAGF